MKSCENGFVVIAAGEHVVETLPAQWRKRDAIRVVVVSGEDATTGEVEGWSEVQEDEIVSAVLELKPNDPRKKQGFDRFDRSVGRLTGAEWQLT